jgi:hypothetical protein
MKDILNRIDKTLETFEPISLAQMSGIKLMNRIDTKYLINVHQLPDLLEKAQSEYYVQKIDGLCKAFYQTVYYDTPEAEMFVIHQNSKLNRQKIRIREYVESAQRFLEVKKKNNKGRTKKVRISVSTEDVLDKLDAINFINEKSNYSTEQLSKRLKNNFYRITLVNKGKTERLTIDINIKFENYITGTVNGFPQLCIIEVKQDGNVHSPFKDYLADLRIKKKSISKYCLGMVITDPELKANRFKSKLIYINRLIKNDAINTTQQLEYVWD